jgi:hypothetical protein
MFLQIGYSKMKLWQYMFLQIVEYKKIHLIIIWGMHVPCRSTPCSMQQCQWRPYLHQVLCKNIVARTSVERPNDNYESISSQLSLSLAYHLPTRSLHILFLWRYGFLDKGPFNSFCLPLPLFLNYSDICSQFCLVGTLINKAHRNYVVYGLEMVLALT